MRGGVVPFVPCWWPESVGTVSTSFTRSVHVPISIPNTVLAAR